MAYFVEKLQKSAFFFEKYLHNSKISCNFAAILQIKHWNLIFKQIKRV